MWRKAMNLRRVLSGGVLAVAMGGSALAAPALWEVRDADSSVWLFGSVHLLRPATEWRTPLFDDLVKKADKVYFETDVSPAGQVAVTSKTFELGFYRDGTLLSKRLDEAAMEKLRMAAQAHDIPVPSLLIMRPWMVATTLSVVALSNAGYDPLSGVETVLGIEIDDGRTGFLETPEEQVSMLSGGDENEQMSMLQATLDSMENVGEDTDRMVDAWLAGTPDALGDTFTAQMAGYDQSFMTRLIDDRNANWVVQIKRMLAENEEALLVVGAAHLIEDTSVVKLLEAEGFTSERLQ